MSDDKKPREFEAPGHTCSSEYRELYAAYDQVVAERDELLKKFNEAKESDFKMAWVTSEDGNPNMAEQLLIDYKKIKAELATLRAELETEKQKHALTAKALYEHSGRNLEVFDKLRSDLALANNMCEKLAAALETISSNPTGSSFDPLQHHNNWTSWAKRYSNEALIEYLDFKERNK